MFSSISISKKLTGAFSMLVLAILFLGGFSLNGLSTVKGSLVEMGDRSLPSVKWSSQMSIATSDYRGGLMKYVLASDAEQRAAAEQYMAAKGAALADAQAQYEPLISSADELALYAQFKRAWEAYQSEASTVIDLARQGLSSSASDHFKAKAYPLSDLAEGTLAKILVENLALADAKREQAGASYANTRTTTFTVLAIVAVVSALTAYLIIRSISSGIASVVQPMTALTRGDLEVEVPSRGERTEIGTIADAVQNFKDALIAKKSADEALAAENAAKMRRAQRLDEITQGFQANVAAMTNALSSAATEMEATAQSMTSIADETNKQSVAVASAAEQTSSNVQTVAAATEELAISIQEITSQVSRSSRIANSAVEDSRRADESVQALAVTAERIESVVSLINNIAGQTNLLALNATIEAARAGEAGRGFAVVASEVKELAGQTTKATEEIGSQITDIQQAIANVVEVIREVAGTISEMSEIANGIAAAMEEQGAATREIARNVQEAARGTEHVTGNIEHVKVGAGETGAAAAQVLGAAQELARQSSDLGSEVAEFLNKTRAA